MKTGFIIIIGIIFLACSTVQKTKDITKSLENYSYIITLKNDTVQIVGHPSKGYIGVNLTGVYYEFKNSNYLRIKVNVVKGCFDGLETIYRNDGSIFSERNFSQRLLNGYSIYYNKDGSIKRKELYEHGKLILPN